MHLAVPHGSLPALAAAPALDFSDEEIAAYVARAVRPIPNGHSAPRSDEAIVSAVYDALTHRRFSALSREGARRYREGVVSALSEPVRRREPLELWFDIGPGYRASLHPGFAPLGFEVGLGEFLMLTQVSVFLRFVGTLYAPGARFRLVVDNLCGLRTNDVAVGRTIRYCEGLRQLIREMGLAGEVRLFVESEEFSQGEYDALLAQAKAPPPALQATQAELDNVARFLGRRCSPREAIERISLYQRTGATTELLLSRVVTGVRLTQRATPLTLGFRSFPGGDARIQCGEVALGRRSDGRVASFLLTSRNLDLYDCARRGVPAVFPSTVSHVTVAAPRS
jgi:hypothetical protein